jgi:hypothetical protein
VILGDDDHFARSELVDQFLRLGLGLVDGDRRGQALFDWRFHITCIEFSRNFKKRMQNRVSLVILEVASPSRHP